MLLDHLYNFNRGSFEVFIFNLIFLKLFCYYFYLRSLEPLSFFSSRDIALSLLLEIFLILFSY